MEVGVNPSTVSRVLRNDAACYISAEKKKKILDISKKYNYTPNVAARNLVLGKTFNIAFVANAFCNFESFGPFVWASIDGIHEELSQAGYFCSMTIIRNLDDIKKLVFSGAYDGFIFGNSVINGGILSFLNTISLPYVFMEDSNATTKGKNRVIVNESAGIEEGVKHLLSLGHREIAVYGNGPHFEGYKKIFHDYKLPFNNYSTFIIPETNIYNLSTVSYIHSEVFVRKHLAFTAICCTNDLVALSLCRRLQENGIKVGTDVSVIGIDNWEQILSYPEAERFLTTVDYCREDIGRESARLLLDIIQNGSEKGIEREVKTKLVVRTSTGQVTHGEI